MVVPKIIGLVDIFLVALLIIFVVHELGHVVIGRAYGAKLDSVTIGYPSLTVERKWWGTRVLISPIFTGVFVKMSQLDQLSWKQMCLTLLGGVLGNLLVVALCWLAGGSALLDLQWHFLRGYYHLFVLGDVGFLVRDTVVNGYLFSKTGVVIYPHAWLGLLCMGNLIMAVFNLIPFPGTDGWWIVVASIEKVLRNMGRETEELVKKLTRANNVVILGITAVIGVLLVRMWALMLVYKQ